MCSILSLLLIFFSFFFFFWGGGGLVMYDNDMIMSLKQKKVTVICRIHYGLADCRSIGRTCIT